MEIGDQAVTGLRILRGHDFLEQGFLMTNNIHQQKTRKLHFLKNVRKKWGKKIPPWCPENVKLTILRGSPRKSKWASPTEFVLPHHHTGFSLPIFTAFQHQTIWFIRIHHHINYHWRKSEYALALNLSLEQFRIVHQLLSSLGNGSRQRQSFLRRLRRTNVPRNHSFWPRSPISCFHSNVPRNHSSWPCRISSLCSTLTCWNPWAGPFLGSFYAGHCGT